MVCVTGPLTLAAGITQWERKETLRSEDLSGAAQELAASIVTQMASTFLEAGADLIMIQEEIVPALSAESCDVWANLLVPAINVVRFYEAIPVLQLANASSVRENWEMIFQRQWDCVVCLPTEVMASQRGTESLRKACVTHGISLPLKLFQADALDGENLRQNHQSILSELRPAIITTAGDVPAATDMKHLVKVLEGIPRSV